MASKGLTPGTNVRRGLTLTSRLIEPRDLQPGHVFAYPTAAHGQVRVKWQREGVVMSSTGWLLDLRHSRALQLWKAI